MRGACRIFAAMALVATLVASSLSAQSTAANVAGTVHDEQRAVVAGASVTLKNRDNGLERQTTTDSTGNFRALGLAPGPYELRVERTGFAPFIDPDVQFSIGRTTPGIGPA